MLYRPYDIFGGFPVDRINLAFVWILAVTGCGAPFTFAVNDGDSGTLDDADVPVGGTLVELSVSASNGPTPSCGADWSGPASTLHDGLTADASVCGCTCGDPTVTCSTSGTPLSAACSVPDGPAQSFVSGQCVPITRSFDLDAPTTHAVCGAPEPSVTTPPISWDRTALACTPSTSGSTPATDPGFNLCVMYDGDVTCPSGPYTNRIVEFSGTTDHRGCTTCACAAPVDVSCGTGGTWTAYTDSSCTTVWKAPNGDLGVYDVPSTCAGPASGWAEYQESGAAGTCGGSPVQATGIAVPSQPWTFCCMP